MSEVSNCCRADIHYGHCTECEKPCRVYRGNTTNDPEQKYGEREKHSPLLSDKRIGKWEDHYDVYYEKGHDGSVAHEHHFPKGPLYFSSGASMARDFYESLIADGTLIRRDDLVVLMKAELENHYTALNYMDAILDHLNKKPA